MKDTKRALLNVARIKFKYFEYGDLSALEEIAEQLKIPRLRDELEENHNIKDIDELLEMLFYMNSIIISTETFGFADKYYANAHELYYEMKIDLFEMLDIDLDWFFEDN